MKAAQTLLLASVLALVTAAQALAAPQGVLKVDPRPAPELALKDLDGERYELADQPGHWIMVHFWASWCPPCREEMPTIEAMARKLADTGLEVRLVNTAEDAETAFTFLAAHAPQLETLLDPDGRVTDAWQPRGLPATFLVGPHGRIQYMALGGRDWDSPAYLGFLRSLTEDSGR